MELIILILLTIIYKIISNPLYKKEDVSKYKVNYNKSLRRKGIIDNNILQDNIINHEDHCNACNSDNDCCGFDD